MKTATIDEAKDHLLGLILDAQRGETVYITDGGVRVAQLLAPPSGIEDDEARLARLERQGGIRRATRGPLTAEELELRLDGRPPSGVLDALLDEREHGR